MKRRWNQVAGVLLLGVMLCAGAVEEQGIVRAIGELGAPSYSARERAMRELLAAGASAEELLQRAIESDNREIAARARQVLLDIRCGLRPETPEAVVELVRGYFSAEPARKRVIVQALAEKGESSDLFLARLASLEKDENLREVLFRDIARRAAERVKECLARGEVAAAEQMLELAVVGENDYDAAPARAYAIHCLLAGTLEEKIARLRPEAQRSRMGAVVLTYLARAKGDGELARQAAAKSDSELLVERVLFEQGQWKALADVQRGNDEAGLEDLGFLAASQRLAGQKGELEKTLEKIRGMAEGMRQPWPVAKTLLIHGRCEEAIGLLAADGNWPAVVELRMAQGSYGEALRAARKAMEGAMPQAVRLRVLAGRAMMQLGLREEAGRTFDEVAAALGKAEEAETGAELIETELNLHRVEGAIGHCAALLAARGDEAVDDLLGALFGRKAEVGKAWYDLMLRRGEAREAALRRSWRMVHRRLGVEEAEALAGAASEMALKLLPSRRDALLWAAAQSMLDYGREKRAEELLLQLVAVAQPSYALAALGDLALRRKEWEKAAAYYGRATGIRSTRYGSQYLRGYALAQKGEAGEELMRGALVAPLADDTARVQLVETLRGAGFEEEAGKQERMLLAVGRFDSSELMGTQHALARRASEAGRHAEAAEGWERILFRCLYAAASFGRAGAFVSVGATVQRHRAAALLEAGKVEAALEAMRAAEGIAPGDIGLAIDLWGPLHKAGRGEEAEALYRRAKAFQAKLLAEYPESSMLHNGLAWMAARCGRELEEALAHARRAVELEPENTAVIDTLAEVHFQRGEKEAAAGLMRRCMELEPEVGRHKEALKRIEEGKAETAPPPG